MIATGGDNSVITLWNINRKNNKFDTVTKNKEIKYHTRGINHLDISVDDKLVRHPENNENYINQ